ncbi:MAG TPA: response regulator [Longimicrobiales bacterium]
MTPDRILVVDDEQSAFYLAQDILDTIRPGSYEVVWADSYESGLDALISGAFDLCLLDHGLGTASGIDLLREANARGCVTPVIMITGQRSKQMDMEALAAGAADFLVKGDISASLLERTVRYTISNKRSERALRESEERFRSLADNAAEAIITVDSADNILYANAGATRIFGYEAAELFELPFSALVPEHLRTGAFSLVADLARSAPSGDVLELTGLRRDGSKVPLEITFGEHVVSDALLYSIVMRDVSARRDALEALRKSEERFSRAFRMAPLGITLTVLKDGRILEANERIFRVLGYTAEEMNGRSSVDAGIWKSVDERNAAVEVLSREGRLEGYTARMRTRSGEERIMELHSEIMTVDGEACVLTLLHDVTERTTLEEQLRQAQKMEAVGRLAGGVAHDFNNVLTSILGNADFLLRDLAESSPLRDEVEEIRRGAERARDLTRQLLAFSRKQVLQPRVLDLSVSVRSIEKLLRRLIREDIELLVELVGDPGFVEADPGQLEQVVVNLAVNARDAMPHGGRLTVRLSSVDVGAELSGQFGEAPRPGRYALLEVCDTGTGIPPEVQQHIFEPFFTTKDLGEGTGLGLATVYGIVKQNDGFIELDSSPGATTFRVYLPQAGETVVVVHQPRSAHDRGGEETILVVEDEEHVRSLVRRILRSKGYRVLEAESPTDALSRILPAHGHELDLMITDVVMPVMGGRELAERVLSLHPSLDVIYMSGYTEDEIIRRGIVEMEQRFISKPFTPAQLSRLVRDVLDGVA